MNIILKKSKDNFSYIRYFLFTYIKRYSVYDKNIKDDIFYIPFKKKLNKSYKNALKEYLKKKNIKKFLAVDEDIKDYLKTCFSTIDGENIYNAIFYKILLFLSKNKLNEYEIIFVSDNIKQIKKLIEISAKRVKNISVLTQNPYLYESMKDYVLSKYGILLNIKNKNEKLKKHNKIYVNCGYNRVFEKSFFKNVNMLDIYNVYEDAFNTIILEATSKEKEYTKKLKFPYTIALAEFLYSDEKTKKYKIVSIKK